MKWKTRFAFGLIFNLAVITPALSRLPQDSSHTLLRFADQLLDAHNYEAGITEYGRFLFFHPDHPLAFYAHYQSGMAYKQLGRWELAASCLRRALQLEAPALLRDRMRYQLALVWIAKGDFDLAQLELFKLSQTDSTRAIHDSAILMHGLLLTYKQNWPEAARVFAQARRQMQNFPVLADTLQQLVKQLQMLVHHPQKKSPQAAKWLSPFLPGSGQIYSGHALSGLNALALNAGTSYLLWQAYERRDFRDAVLLFSFLWIRYYLGNRMHAEEAAVRANQAYQEKALQHIYRLLQQAGMLMSTERLTLEWEDLFLHHASPLP